MGLFSKIKEKFVKEKKKIENEDIVTTNDVEQQKSDSKEENKKEKTVENVKVYEKGLTKSRENFVSKLVGLTNKYKKITDESNERKITDSSLKTDIDLLTGKVNTINNLIGTVDKDNNKNIMDMLNDINQAINNINIQINTLDNRITSLETYGTTNTGLIERIKVLEEKYPQITINSNEITNIKNRIDNINAEHEELYNEVKTYNDSIKQ